MEATPHRPSTLRIALTWAVMVAVIVGVVVAAFWWTHHQLAAKESAAATTGVVAFSIGSLDFGGFFLGLGLFFYLAAIVTGCFSFSFKRPIWKAAKVKLYFANIVVVVLLALGLGFLCAALLGPVLLKLGLDAWMARLLPVMVMVVAVQIMALWVLIWSPLEKWIVKRRLRVMGVSRAEIDSAALVGLSEPGSGFAKRFGMIEEDLGGLWLTPELLIYRGDGEQFGLAREQLAQMERRADNRSTSVLGGIATSSCTSICRIAASAKSACIRKGNGRWPGNARRWTPWPGRLPNGMPGGRLRTRPRSQGYRNSNRQGAESAKVFRLISRRLCVPGALAVYSVG